jgi:replicative DNA helicase
LEFTMAAQRAHRPLALVTQRNGDAARPNRRGETIARQWDPEAQLVGALMHLSAAQANAILELIPDSAIWRPATRWAIEIIRYLVAQNADPDPVTVLHTARRQAPMDAPSHARVSPRRLHLLAVHLADLYTQTVAPQLARQYAREVLEDAFQRAVCDHGTRLTELAESGADRPELAEHIAGMRATLTDLWRRAEAARQIH